MKYEILLFLNSFNSIKIVKFKILEILSRIDIFNLIIN